MSATVGAHISAPRDLEVRAWARSFGSVSKSRGVSAILTLFRGPGLGRTNDETYLEKHRHTLLHTTG